MDSVKSALSKLKKNLDSIINDYKNSVSEIEKEEEFIQVLGDVVNYSKSDCLLLPFYDETILSRVFEKVFPLSTSEIKKIKTAKYLIEASKSVDKSNFLQYNNSVQDLEEINNKLSSTYEELLADDHLKKDKDDYNNKISLFSGLVDIIGEEDFSALISDIDLFEEAINLCKFKDEEINTLLNVAITSNLKYLDSNGIISEEVHSDIVDMKNENNKMQEEIENLSNLLGNEQEDLWN